EYALWSFLDATNIRILFRLRLARIDSHHRPRHSDSADLLSDAQQIQVPARAYFICSSHSNRAAAICLLFFVSYAFSLVRVVVCFYLPYSVLVVILWTHIVPHSSSIWSLRLRLLVFLSTYGILGFLAAQTDPLQQHSWLALYPFFFL